MKTRILIVWLLSALAVSAAHVQFNVQDFIASAVGSRRIVVTPISAPTTDGSFVVVGTQGTYTNAADGSLTISNMVEGFYRVNIAGTMGNVFTIWTPNTNAVLNAVDLVVPPSLAQQTVGGYIGINNAKYVTRNNGVATNLWVTNLTVVGTITGITNATGGEVTTDQLNTASNVLATATSLKADTNSPTLFTPTLMAWNMPAGLKAQWGDDGWIWYDTSDDSFILSNAFHSKIVKVDSLDGPLSIATRSAVTNIVQAIGGGSSTVTNLDDVGDVTLGSPANGDVLKYDSTSSRWTNSPDLVGAEGSGLASLNGLTNSSQSFAVGESGTVPAWVSAGGTHTLNLPYASNNVHGIIASNDWATFLAKASISQLQSATNDAYAYSRSTTNGLLDAAKSYADSVGGGSGGLAAINGIGSNITLRAAALSGPPLTLIGNADGSSDTFSVLSPGLANLFSVESDGGIIAAKNAAFQGHVTVTSNLNVGGTASYGTLAADTLDAGEITATNLTASRILATDSSNVVVSVEAGVAGQVLTSTGTGYQWSDATGGSGGGSTLVIQTNSVLVGTLQNLRLQTNGVLVGTL